MAGGQGNIRVLPAEIIYWIFSLISPNEIYEKFIEPYSLKRFTYIQDIAYSRIITAVCVIRSYDPRKEFDSIDIFYSEKQLKSSFVLIGFKKAYDALRNQIYYFMENKKYVFPEEIGLFFNFGCDPINDYLHDEIEYFIKFLEVLAIYLYYIDANPKINVQVSYDTMPCGEIVIKSNKITEKLTNLSTMINKFMVHNKFSSEEPVTNLHLLYPSNFENLEEVHLWNNGLNNYLIKPYLKSAVTNLKIIDLRANNITCIQDLVIPPMLEQLIIIANNLISLKGPNYAEATNLYLLDASINAISDIDHIEFPPNLKSLKISYNSISKIDNFHIPQNLEVLALSKNTIKDLDDVILPVTLREFHLSANGLKCLSEGFFFSTPNLIVLDLSDNIIDDLDDLGILPNSLSELILDNNEIDYSNLSNILTTNLTKLSMVSTGLISLTNIQFPDKLKELNLSKNEISEIIDVTFGSDSFTNLNLSNNKLCQFNLPGDNINLPDTLKFLDLSNNLFDGFESFRLPHNLTSLLLNGLNLGLINNKIVNQFPRSLKELQLNNTNKSKKPTELNVDFSTLENLEILSLDRNNICSINQVKYPKSLRNLSYEYNSIQTIDFLKITTGIKVLKFNHNLICDF